VVGQINYMNFVEIFRQLFRQRGNYRPQGVVDGFGGGEDLGHVRIEGNDQRIFGPASVKNGWDGLCRSQIYIPYVIDSIWIFAFGRSCIIIITKTRKRGIQAFRVFVISTFRD
jgi:hypothetical protein